MVTSLKTSIVPKIKTISPSSVSAIVPSLLPSKLSATAKDVLLAPIYLYQGHKVKRDTVRLPEPEGERHGQVPLGDVSQDLSSQKQILSVMLVGDSAAAGVGSDNQQQALVGNLIPALQQQNVINSKFDTLSWSVQATTGHTSFDILRRLYVLATPIRSVDVMAISVGVNDTTANISPSKWQQQIREIISIAQRKFGVKSLIFLSLPLMAQMPALPAPLNSYVGAKATKLDEILQQICQEQDGVHYMATDWASMIADYSQGGPLNKKAMFASDGFHPSSITYGYWAQQLAKLINDLVVS